MAPFSTNQDRIMRNHWLVFLPMTVLMMIVPSADAIGDLIIENARIVSPERSEILENSWIKVVNGRISAISSKPIPSDGVPSLDANGRYLMPGITDSHVHLGRMPGTIWIDGEAATHLEDLAEIYRKQEPRSYLYFGVTQLIDVASAPAAVNAFQDNPLSPDLFFCGATPFMGSYPTVFAEKPKHAHAMFPYMIAPSAESDNPRSPESQVARMSDDDAICVKIHIEDGFGANSDWPMLKSDTVSRIQTEARKRNMAVVAHANAFDMQQIAVGLEVDVMAHGMWNWTPLRGVDGLPAPIQSLLENIITQDIAYQPTLTVIDALRQTVADQGLRDPLYRKSTPAALLQWYATDEAKWFREELMRDFDGAPTETILGWQRRTFDQGARVLKYLAGRNATLLLASDTPSSPVNVSQPGFNTRLEMRQMVEAGVSLRQLLEAATINNARTFGLDRDFGTIEVGKVANLLLLGENPLEQVDAYDSIQSVILRGQVIERETLSAEWVE